MLADISGVDAIYIVTGYTDMRKAIDGLCAIIQEQMSKDPQSNELYLFCGRRADRIKVKAFRPFQREAKRADPRSDESL